ncbi:M48 family metalloprotease [Curtobacterium sp. RRHDQ10]|uniref:M48 family metalloprotease n=1 Tax=Curtobacterium phyllosphaerae TaxID=3413379 RepID=UPI003BF39B3B
MVVVGVVLLAVAVAVVALAPRGLTRWAWTIDRPRTALAAWSGSVVLGVVGFVGGIALVALAGRPADDPFGIVGSPTHGVHLVVAVAGVAAFVIAVRVRPGPEHVAVREAMRAGAAPHRLVDGTIVAVVEADHALACAVPGRSGGVLVSSGLRARLDDREFAAVVAHEAAHLRGRHALVVAVAESIERAVPWVPGARAMARSTRVLVEFAADDAAARRTGADVVARAVLAADSASALTRVRVARLVGPSSPDPRRDPSPRRDPDPRQGES